MTVLLDCGRAYSAFWSISAVSGVVASVGVGVERTMVGTAVGVETESAGVGTMVEIEAWGREGVGIIGLNGRQPLKRRANVTRNRGSRFIFTV